MLTSLFFSGWLAAGAAQPEFWVRARVELPSAALHVESAPARRFGGSWSLTAGVRLTPEAGGAASGEAVAQRRTLLSPSGGRRHG